ncbi:MAG: choice-of-anchor Q domain-containing protein [Dokdonella sp.]|uniref:choice-of-anchor Q domain-containing protein n=1 Tax=Dokdonella sp. TaxID=2291710 RepID=UPI003F806D82
MFPCPFRAIPRLASSALATLLAAAPAGAATLTWPGSPPCATTLQACIAGAAAGDVVEIASDGPIEAALEIQGKSLTLRAADGFTPVLQAGTSTDVIDAFGANTEVTIVIEGLTVRGGSITAYQAGSGPFDITIRGNIVEAEALDSNRTAIRLTTFGATPTGPVDFAITDNDVRLGFLEGDDIAAIGIDDLPGATTGAIERNTIGDGGAWSTLGAVLVRNGDGAADVLLRHNRIEATGYNGGIVLVQDGAGGTLGARVFNNLVTGTVGVMGPQPGAISLRANAGSLHADVFGDTLVGNHTGFVAGAGAGASLTGTLANTLVAGNAVHGIVIGATAASGFTNEHNLVFGNEGDDFTPGAGTVEADPAFIGAGDYRLRADSPARDAGNSVFATDIAVDLDGAVRILGPAIDIGAWEVGDAIFADGFDA